MQQATVPDSKPAYFVGGRDYLRNAVTFSKYSYIGVVGWTDFVLFAIFDNRRVKLLVQYTQ